MRDYGKISTSIWQSKKFKSLDSDDYRLLYLYLHTSLHVNSIGCFRLPIGYITADLRWTEKTTDRAMIGLSKANLIKWDKTEEVVFILGFLGQSPITNIKHAVGAAKLALSLPDSPLKHDIIQELLEDKYAGGLSEFKGYLYPYDRAMDTTETEPETEPETDSKSLVVSKNNEKENRFDEFWLLFPRQRRGNKAKATIAYKRALKENRATDNEIIAGVENYAKSSEVADGYAKGAEAWINDDRWASEYGKSINPGGNGRNNPDIVEAVNAAIQRRVRPGQQCGEHESSSSNSRGPETIGDYGTGTIIDHDAT